MCEDSNVSWQAALTDQSTAKRQMTSDKISCERPCVNRVFAESYWINSHLNVSIFEPRFLSATGICTNVHICVYSQGTFSHNTTHNPRHQSRPRVNLPYDPRNLGIVGTIHREFSPDDRPPALLLTAYPPINQPTTNTRPSSHYRIAHSAHSGLDRQTIFSLSHSNTPKQTRQPTEQQSCPSRNPRKISAKAPRSTRSESP